MFREPTLECIMCGLDADVGILEQKEDGSQIVASSPCLPCSYAFSLNRTQGTTEMAGYTA